MKVLTCFTLVVLAITTTWVFADESTLTQDIQMGVPSYEGSACPSGTLDISVDQVSKKLNFKFNSSIALHLSEPPGIESDEKVCTISIPIKVPKKRVFGLNPVEYNGSVTLPGESSAIFTIAYTYEYPYGTPWQSYKYTFNGELNRYYSFMAAKNSNSTPFWAACGENTTLRVKLTIQAQTKYPTLPSSFTLDSINRFELTTQTCN